MITILKTIYYFTVKKGKNLPYYLTAINLLRNDSKYIII